MACCCLVAKSCLTFLWPHGLSVGFSRQEYWSRFPFPSPGNLPGPGIEPVAPAASPAASPALRAGSLSLSHYFVLLDCFPFLLHFFFQFSDEIYSWTKVFLWQKTGGGHGSAPILRRLPRVVLSYMFITQLSLYLLNTQQRPWPVQPSVWEVSLILTLFAWR